MIKIKLTVDTSDVDRKLSELISKTTHLRPVMRAISEDMLYAVKENFETQGARLGKKWEELSPKTKEARKKKGYGLSILQQRRKLFDSLTAYADNNVAQVGTNLLYARVHQLGSEGSRKPEMNIPARPFLGLNDRDMDGIKNTIVKYLEF